MHTRRDWFGPEMDDAVCERFCELQIRLAPAHSGWDEAVMLFMERP
jgi:hypothetical protein